MKKTLTVALCALSITANAYVPLDVRLGGSSIGLPSVRPVHGPIRPNAALDPHPQKDTKLLRHEDYMAPQLTTWPIFWGKEWAHGRESQKKIAGLESWYTGYKGSNYSRVLNEYLLRARDNPMPSEVDFEGYSLDLNPVPARKQADIDFDSYAVVQEICDQIDKGVVPPNIGYYPVYMARKPPIGGSCGVRGWSLCGVNSINYALIYDLDNVPGCDPDDRVTGHSRGLAALANASARALSDAQIDDLFAGYYDSSGNEMDDKCAGIFSAPFVVFTNGSIWKLQDLWSNRAYETGRGHPNANGELGCVNGR